MKFLITTSLLIAFLQRASSEYGIDLPVIIVSRITKEKRWCLTASDDATDVSLQRCDFEGAPASQIWYRTDDENFLTSIVPFDGNVNSNNSCLSDDNGKLFISPCEIGGGEQRFYSWPGPVVTIESHSQGCVGLKDETPRTGGEITIIPCENNGRSTWRYHYISCDPLSGNYGYQYYRLCNNGGCIKAFNAGTRKTSNKVKVVVEPFADWWAFDGEAFDAICFGTGLLRLLRNPTLCLQTGNGTEPVKEGTQMRVYPCDCNSELQQNKCDREFLGCIIKSAGSDRVVYGGESCWSNPNRISQQMPQVDNEFPVPLITAHADFDIKVESGDRFVANIADGRLICIVQQNDGNFRVLRVEDPGDCEDNSGTLIFDSGFSLKLPSNEKYYTRLQRDGNLVTRKSDSRKVVWKTCSAQGGMNDEVSLVLNENNSLSILSSIGDEIWNSEIDKSCYIGRPLILMTTAPGGQNKLEYGHPLKVSDPLTDSDVCLVQQGDGNFKVLRGGCNSGAGLFRSGYSLNLPNNEKYYTKLQRDGNLITFKSVSGEWVWKTCSSQGAVSKVFSLVVDKDDTLSIIDENGELIWNSAFDSTCFA